MNNTPATDGAAPTPAATSTQSPSLTRGTMIAAALAVCVAQVGIAIPAVLNGLFQQDLGTSASQLTWISDAFLVPVTLLELSFGVVGDLFGRKRLLVIGAALLAIGEFIAVLTPGLSSSTGTRVAVLLTGQVIAGIGAAALFPTSLAMIAAGTHTAERRNRSVTTWAAMLSFGGAISPIVGGFLARYSFGSDPNASWRWGFLFVGIVATLSALVSWRMATNSSAPQGRSLDWPGQITIAIALFALLFAVIQGPTSGWGSGLVIGGFIVFVLAFVAFIAAERRSTAPLLRLDLFSNRAFAIAAVATVIGMFAFLGTAYATSIRLSSIQGFTPLKTSIAFILLNGIALVQMPLTHRLMTRINPKWLLSGGMGLIFVGDLWMSQLSAANRSIAPIIVPLALAGIGFALSVSAVTAVAVNTAPNHLAGMASGTTSLLRDFGFTLGPAVIGAVALSHATTLLHEKISSTPALQAGLKAFQQAPQHVPAEQKASVQGAVDAVMSGPLGANAVPSTVTAGGKTEPFNPLKDAAFHALNTSYSIGFIVCAIGALVACLIAIAIPGGSRDVLIESDSLVDPEGATAANPAV
ncbi:MFS transporter [Rudaeicoccus suwonensis]|uniref:MFS transporter n=1 Tax=Rudaeicoccus suwonensis TaxID=657409 RepID=A0A561E377_9MICO|nr:MFS transporter [Rudaeicoccus suwonensis]TWE10050.1 MFS transporter [Rudaeicoccus suwonensis]